MQNSHKVEPSRLVNSRELIAKQPPRHRSSNHGRDSGRKHSPTHNNYFLPQRTTVARKSSRRDSHSERYSSGQMPFQGPSQSSAIEQRREPSQLSQLGLGLSPKGPLLDRRSAYEIDSKNRGTDINRLGAIDAKFSRSQIRWARDDNHKVGER